VEHKANLEQHGRESYPESAASLRRQLAEARANLQLVRERKSQYVQEVDVPLQLVREEHRLLKCLDALERELAEIQPKEMPLDTEPELEETPTDAESEPLLSLPLAAWGVLGFGVTVLITFLFSQPLRCVLEFRMTEATVALIGLLAAGAGMVFSKIAPQRIREALQGFYGGLAVTLLVVVAARRSTFHRPRSI